MDPFDPEAVGAAYDAVAAEYVAAFAGVAACVVTPLAAAGPSGGSAVFLGSPGLDGSSTTAPVVVNLEEAMATYAGPTSVASNVPAILEGTLTEDGITPLAGKLLTFSVGTGVSEQTCAAITDATGSAACSIVPNQALGAIPVGVSFGGDARYQAAAASDSAIVFAWLESGAFVIGDAVSSIGTHFTFSSPQWCVTNNPSSGCSASFKGFADGLATNPPLVGQSWTALPGNSGQAPTSMPPYMGVIVTSAASKLAHAISGNLEHLVVAAVDPGSSISGTIVGVAA